MARLDRDRFREWLASRGDRWSGDAHDGFSCPLACFLADTHGSLDYHVRELDWRPLDTGPWRPLPTWAVEFVRALDVERPFGDREQAGITASEALALLDSQPKR